MGTMMAPSYANLFMGLFEESHIYSGHQYVANLVFYRRYIGDLLFIWEGNEEEI